MTTLGDVEEATYIAFNKQVVKMVTGGNRSGIHVSDMVEPKCLRKIYYEKKLPVPMTGNTCKNFYAGNIVHAHSDLSTIPDYHEFQIAYNPVKDICIDLEAEQKNHPKPDDLYWESIIVGTIDDVIRLDTGEYMIADKKTKASKPQTMLFGKQYDSIKPEHKSQLNMYRLLLLKKTGIDAKYGCILSLDFADKFNHPKPQPFELDDITKTRMNIMQRMEELTKHLRNNSLPDRTIQNWMCDEYCSYFSMCFTGDGQNV